MQVNKKIEVETLVVSDLQIAVLVLWKDSGNSDVTGSVLMLMQIVLLANVFIAQLDDHSCFSLFLNRTIIPIRRNGPTDVLDITTTLLFQQYQISSCSTSFCSAKVCDIFVVVRLVDNRSGKVRSLRSFLSD
jgi:hypothetical protein